MTLPMLPRPSEAVSTTVIHWPTSLVVGEYCDPCVVGEPGIGVQLLPRLLEQLSHCTFTPCGAWLQPPGTSVSAWPWSSGPEIEGGVSLVGWAAAGAASRAPLIAP